MQAGPNNLQSVENKTLPNISGPLGDMEQNSSQYLTFLQEGDLGMRKAETLDNRGYRSPKDNHLKTIVSEKFSVRSQTVNSEPSAEQRLWLALKA